MFRSDKRHSALFGKRALLVTLVLGTAAFAAVPASDDPGQLLRQADGIKTSNHDEFSVLIQRLGSGAVKLSSEQQLYLRYLKAWQVAHHGDYEIAIPLLDAVAKESKDADLKSRARATAINVLAISSHYEQAFDRLSLLLEQLPQVTDNSTRRQGLTVAAQLYINAGQYDLAKAYAGQLFRENSAGANACRSRCYDLESRYKSANYSQLTSSSKMVPMLVPRWARSSSQTGFALI